MSSDVSRSGKPAVVAHRGASGENAEHTLLAYERALEQGADGLECDVRLTADHQLVCVHDRTIERTSDGVGAVSELTLAQLRDYDFGSWHSGVPAQVLTLRELLTLTLDWRRPVRLFIETKHPVRFGSLVEQQLLDVLHEFGVGSPPSADHSRAVVISPPPLAQASAAPRAPPGSRGSNAAAICSQCRSSSGWMVGVSVPVTDVELPGT